MGVTLYKPGNTKTIKGIKCDMQTFDEYSYIHNLGNGWFYSPEECYQETKEPDVEKEILPVDEVFLSDIEVLELNEKEETTGKPDVALNLDEMTDDDIRALSKEKGIKNWYNKGIDKLKLEIDAWQPEI